MKKRQHLRRVRAATKIQALARGIHGRKWMKKNRRRLTRERAARLKVEAVVRYLVPKLCRNCIFFIGAAAESVYSYTVLLPKSSSPSGGRSTKKSKGSRAQRTERMGRAGAKSRWLAWRIYAAINGHSYGDWGKRNGRQKVSVSIYWAVSQRLYGISVLI